MQCVKSMAALGLSVALSIVLISCDSSTSSDSSSTTFTDSRDGQVYGFVKIGTQTWMSRNLNYRGTSGKTDTVGVCYNDSSSNCAKYGRLYQWAEAMGLSSTYNTASWRGADSAHHQGICPSGWHVPTDTEWGTLLAYVGADSARIQLSSTSGWGSGNNGTDTFGFSALPAGNHRYDDGKSLNLGIGSFFWSSSESGMYYAWDRSFSQGHRNVEHHNGNYKTYGFSLRCIRNN